MITVTYNILSGKA